MNTYTVTLLVTLDADSEADAARFARSLVPFSEVADVVLEDDGTIGEPCE